MSQQIEFDAVRDVIVMTASGPADLASVMACFEILFPQLERHATAGVIMDFTAATAIEFSGENVRPVALHFGNHRGLLGTRKYANVVAGDLEFGIIRMWMSMLEGRTDMELGLFRTKAEALDWMDM